VKRKRICSLAERGYTLGGLKISCGMRIKVWLINKVEKGFNSELCEGIKISAVKNQAKQSPHCITGEHSPVHLSSSPEFPVKGSVLSSPSQHCEYRKHGTTEFRMKRKTNM